METALYRHFDKDGVLLYIGISLNPFNRLNQHFIVSEWVTEITDIKIEWYDTREEAVEAERQAIKMEKNPCSTIMGFAPITPVR